MSNHSPVLASHLGYLWLMLVSELFKGILLFYSLARKGLSFLPDNSIGSAL